MSMTRMTRFYAGMIDRYVDGRLPLPGWLLQLLLNVINEWYFRFSKSYDELPVEWSGDSGAIAEKSDALMKIHYDKPRILFENFLGPTMKYTMALWERGAQNLEEAQEAMMADLCQKAGIEDGQNVLDIACGFGSLSAHILKHYPNCTVTALNLSKVQVDYITEKQSEQGHPMHTDRFRVIREDFSKADFGRDYDRIMVIGLFEHIRNLRGALEKISGFLKPEGKVLLHYITYNRIIKAVADPTSDLFFDKYIFPGGRFWYFGELPRYNDHLKVDQSWFLNGNNYKRTLQAWLDNFWKNIETIRSHPDMDPEFERVWDLYLRFCIATFGGVGGKSVGNGQYLLTHTKPVA